MQRRQGTDKDSPASSPMSPSINMSTSIADLSNRLRHYSLQPQNDYIESGHLSSPAFHPFSSYDTPPTPPGEPSSPISDNAPSFQSPFVSADFHTISPPSSPRLSSSYTTSANIRRQRQNALRRQTSSGHLQEIRALVARMVSEGDQCNVVGAVEAPLTSPSGTSTPCDVRSRQNSDLTSGTDTFQRSDAAYMSDDESTSCSWIGGEAGSEVDIEPCVNAHDWSRAHGGEPCLGWHCPWTSRSLRATADNKRGVRKDKSARKTTRRRNLQ